MGLDWIVKRNGVAVRLEESSIGMTFDPYMDGAVLLQLEGLGVNPWNPMEPAWKGQRVPAREMNSQEMSDLGYALLRTTCRGLGKGDFNFEVACIGTWLLYWALHDDCTVEPQW